ncbi:helix-turn-helix domain-containing protein [Enterococcus faecium]|uniref:helix-turn-helix domain-containing protein n=1 Tax=Enterococcus faecium TaxID=1352 RepID=UPI00339267C0
MTTFERIKKIAKQRGLNIKELSKRVGFGESTIYKWKNQEPKSEYLKKVADYLDVSTDYLLGQTDTPTKTETSTKDLEEELKSNTYLYYGGEKLTEEDKKEIENYLDYYIFKKKKNL